MLFFPKLVVLLFMVIVENVFFLGEITHTFTFHNLCGRLIEQLVACI